MKQHAPLSQLFRKQSRRIPQSKFMVNLNNTVKLYQREKGERGRKREKEREIKKKEREERKKGGRQADILHLKPSLFSITFLQVMWSTFKILI